MFDLEPLNGGLRLRPEQSVKGTGFVPEAPQYALYVENARRIVRGAVAGSRTKGRRGPLLVCGRGAERRAGLWAHDAVDRQAVRRLEAPNRAFGRRPVEAIDPADRVGRRAQSALQLAYVRGPAVDGIARARSEEALDLAAGTRGRFTPIRSSSRKARPRQAQQKHCGQRARRRLTGQGEETERSGLDGRRIDRQRAETLAATCNATCSSG